MNDADEQLLKRRHIVTFERAAKGDLHITRDAAGYMAAASVIDNSILTKLHEKRILGWKHVEAAATYCLWQSAFDRPFYAEPRKVYMVEIAGGTPNGQQDEANYRWLLRLLNRLDQHIIERVIIGDYIEPETDADRVRQAHTNKQAVMAFDALCAAIPKAIEKAKETTCAIMKS